MTISVPRTSGPNHFLAAQSPLRSWSDFGSGANCEADGAGRTARAAASNHKRVIDPLRQPKLARVHQPAGLLSWIKLVDGPPVHSGTDSESGAELRIHVGLVAITEIAGQRRKRA